MAETDANEQVSVEESADRRERSTISFPYGDLNEAISIADAINRNAGNTQCDLDQVAGWMNQSVTSGAFRTKVNAARIFGLVTTGQSKLTLTQLGQRIVDPDAEAAARVEAFLNVPLYKEIFEAYKAGGGTLPAAVGLERHMAELGVAQKQTDKARQAFQRSAQQAGFFAAGNNRLVRPGLAPVEMGDHGRGGGGGGDDGSSDLHPLLAGLVKTLPPAQSQWSEAEQGEWIEAAKAIFKLIYKRGARASAPPTEPEQPS